MTQLYGVILRLNDGNSNKEYYGDKRGHGED
jgi:hypothetical protein